MIFGGPAGCCGGEIQGMSQLIDAIAYTGLAILGLSLAVVMLSRLINGWRR